MMTAMEGQSPPMESKSKCSQPSFPPPFSVSDPASATAAASTTVAGRRHSVRICAMVAFHIKYSSASQFILHSMDGGKNPRIGGIKQPPEKQQGKHATTHRYTHKVYDGGVSLEEGRACLVPLAGGRYREGDLTLRKYALEEKYMGENKGGLRFSEYGDCWRHINPIFRFKVGQIPITAV